MYAAVRQSKVNPGSEQAIMWFRILILALGTFAIGTDVFVIAGILPSIAHDLGVSVSLAGLLVTAFSLAYALGSPVLATLTGRVARRQLLLLALVSFALANVLAAVATSFVLLLVARVLAALSAALYTPNALAVAAFLAPKEKRGQALALVMAGASIATVVGVPLGVLIGTQNWQATFVLIALLAVIAFIGVLTLFPSVASQRTVGLRTRLSLLCRPVIGMILVTTVLWILGSFTLYTYLSPLLLHLTHLQGPSISALFLFFGVANVIGNVLGGYGADHWGTVRTILFGLLGLIAALFTLSLVSGSLWGVVCVIGVWGIAAWLVSAPQQHRLIAQVPESVSVVLSLNSSAIYMGLGIAAALGGLVIQYLSLAALGWVGGTIELVALVVLGLSVWLTRTTVHQTATEQMESTVVVQSL